MNSGLAEGYMTYILQEGLPGFHPPEIETPGYDVDKFQYTADLKFKSEGKYILLMMKKSLYLFL
jgi:hypothetical protein